MLEVVLCTLNCLARSFLFGFRLATHGRLFPSINVDRRPGARTVTTRTRSYSLMMIPSPDCTAWSLRRPGETTCSRPIAQTCSAVSGAGSNVPLLPQSPWTWCLKYWRTLSMPTLGYVTTPGLNKKTGLRGALSPAARAMAGPISGYRARILRAQSVAD